MTTKPTFHIANRFGVVNTVTAFINSLWFMLRNIRAFNIET